MDRMKILSSVAVGLSTMAASFLTLYAISPVDGLLKMLLYVGGSYVLSMYMALYVGNKKIEIKAVGWDFYETC